MGIPELMRIFVDIEKIDWDTVGPSQILLIFSFLFIFPAINQEIIYMSSKLRITIF